MNGVMLATLAIRPEDLELSQVALNAQRLRHLLDGREFRAPAREQLNIIQG
jgi:hypothetical protein